MNMLKCKHCSGSNIIKDGIVLGKQRYKCKECARTFREGDARVIHDFNKRIKVLKWYLEGAGIRSISRMEGVSAPVIIDWIRDYAKIIKNKINEMPFPKDVKEVQILEVDELFTYYQKKLIKSTYGLLLIESEMKLLILK
jgi:transposase-like protein